MVTMETILLIDYKTYTRVITLTTDERGGGGALGSASNIIQTGYKVFNLSALRY